ncbi:MAG: hypothetical protein M3O74_13770 [Pseudomonadota bacterium]|nr:hypothetical protein [Pseudomonadota bacterium]
MSKEFVAGYVAVDEMTKAGRIADQQNEIQGLKNDLDRAQKNNQTVGLPVTASRKDREELRELRERVALLEKREYFLINESRKQEEMLFGWIVSQKAFKETAQVYGAMAGRTPEEIHREGLACKATILNGESIYGNNVEMSDDMREKIKSTLI